jgi:hypothetical protein
MGPVTENPFSPAHTRFLGEIELAVLLGHGRYPSGSAFVDAERLAALAPMVTRHIREGRPIVLVHPDGDLQLVRPEPLFAPGLGGFFDRVWRRLRWPSTARTRRFEEEWPELRGKRQSVGRRHKPRKRRPTSEGTRAP